MDAYALLFAATLNAGPGLVVLTGSNGAGKTNILEAISFLSPGRGLRAGGPANPASITHTTISVTAMNAGSGSSTTGTSLRLRAAVGQPARGYSSASSLVMSPTDALASPNSIDVIGSK